MSDYLLLSATERQSKCKGGTVLVITSRTGQTIRIGDEIVISIERIDGSEARIGISAPKEIPIIRE